jgi:hypothetical protein
MTVIFLNILFDYDNNCGIQLALAFISYAEGYSERVNAEINWPNLQSLSTTLDPDRRTLSHTLMCLVDPLVFGTELVRTV